MKVLELNFVFRVLDIVLFPFNYLLGGLKIPVQESHPWHMIEVKEGVLDEKKMIVVNNYDGKSKFYHDAPFGLYHMPIFGGLTKYIVIEVESLNDHWHVGWKGVRYQVNKLKIYDNRLKLLYGRNPYKVFGINDNGDILRLKVVGSGKIGDGKFSGLRLF